MRLLAEAAGPPSHDPRPAHIARTDWEEAERQLREAVRMLRRLALACDGPVPLTRLEQHSDAFRKSLDRALDRSEIDHTSLENGINQYVKDFERATDPFLISSARFTGSRCRS